MTDCRYCATNSATYSLSSPCCAARFARKVATDQYDKTLAKLANDHGHSLADLKAEADRQRKKAASRLSDAT